MYGGICPYRTGNQEERPDPVQGRWIFNSTREIVAAVDALMKSAALRPKVLLNLDERLRGDR